MYSLNWQTFHRDFPVTFVMVLANILLFFAYQIGIIPLQVSIPGVLNFQSFSAHFFHIQLLHLVSNLLICIFSGLILEIPLKSWRYVLVVLSIWNLAVLALFYVSVAPMFGFSAIGMGLLGFAVFYVKNNPEIYQMVGALLLINLFFGLLPSVSFWGHFCGAIAGLSTFWIFRYFER